MLSFKDFSAKLDRKIDKLGGSRSLQAKRIRSNLHIQKDRNDDKPDSVFIKKPKEDRTFQMLRRHAGTVMPGTINKDYLSGKGKK